MKLLIITQAVDREDPNLGAFYYWFEMLAQHAESVVIITGRAGAHDLPSNVSVHTFGTARLGRIGRLWKFWELFARNYANADAVLFHQIPEYVIVAAPFLLAKKKITALWYAHGVVSWRLRIAERLVGYIFTSSAAGFRMPSKKVHHLGQAINTELFSPVLRANHSGGILRMITVGRIASVKNYETIIHACAIVRDTSSQAWVLTIVGGPITPSDRIYGEKIKTLIREKNLEQYIHFYGDRGYSEIPDILREHDMFLNASATGSLDKAVLEAMACGLTVLTSNEAYRAILSLEYFVEHPSAEFLAERIKARAAEPRPNRALRDIVVRDHALERTIEKIAALFAIRV
ncbi:MAG: glycosyltransferase family 4 protein [Candidatus Sungiibacteriota bacterium]